ncbi:hypothetical protein [Kosakonia cowanii]|uniref:hypothetical protein n=1 Tax=Kosakonia cowanii TaxID=208223 RepID=UPI0040631219
MTGREAIEQYMEQYGFFTCELVADAYGLKRSVINGASHKMRQNGEIALDRRVWRTHFYVPVHQDDDEKAVSSSGTNTVFEECRRNWQGYYIHKIFGSARA